MISSRRKTAMERAKKEWDEEFMHYLPYIKDDDFLGVQNYTRSLIGADGQLTKPGWCRAYTDEL